MQQRADIADLSPDSYKAVFALEEQIRSRTPKELLQLVKLRASFINHCTFCLDMHSTDALADGMDQRRVLAVAAWEESPWFSPAERVALALTDSVTRLDGGVDDDMWDLSVDVFGQRETVDLVFAIATINVWNRLAISTHMAPPRLAS